VRATSLLPRPRFGPLAAGVLLVSVVGATWVPAAILVAQPASAAAAPVATSPAASPSAPSAGTAPVPTPSTPVPALTSPSAAFTPGTIQVPAGRAAVGGTTGGVPVLEVAALALAGVSLLGAGTVVLRRR
jgi:hypothetical protein